MPALTGRLLLFTVFLIGPEKAKLDSENKNSCNHQKRSTQGKMTNWFQDEGSQEKRWLLFTGDSVAMRVSAARREQTQFAI